MRVCVCPRRCGLWTGPGCLGGSCVTSAVLCSTAPCTCPLWRSRPSHWTDDRLVMDRQTDGGKVLGGLFDTIRKAVSACVDSLVHSPHLHLLTSCIVDPSIFKNALFLPMRIFHLLLGFQHIRRCVAVYWAMGSSAFLRKMGKNRDFFSSRKIHNS